MNIKYANVELNCVNQMFKPTQFKVLHVVGVKDFSDPSEEGTQYECVPDREAERYSLLGELKTGDHEFLHDFPAELPLMSILDMAEEMAHAMNLPFTKGEYIRSVSHVVKPKTVFEKVNSLLEESSRDYDKACEILLNAVNNIKVVYPNMASLLEESLNLLQASAIPFDEARSMLKAQK